MSDLNYRVGLVVNETGVSIRGQHDVDTVKFADTTNKPVNYIYINRNYTGTYNCCIIDLLMY